MGGIPRMLCLNVRSLSIEKSDEFTISVCVRITERGFRNYMTTESNALSVFNCERKDTNYKAEGGVACYVKDNTVYYRIDYTEDEQHEVVWIRKRPKRLSRQCIIVSCIYHQLDDDNASTRECLDSSLDAILGWHSTCEIILTGDFHQFKDKCVQIHYDYKQIIQCCRRKDKIWTNIEPAYERP